MPKTIEFIIISGWVMLLLACFAIVGFAGYASVNGQESATLKELAGPAFGFLFGSVPVMVKDLLNKTSPPPPAT